MQYLFVLLQDCEWPPLTWINENIGNNEWTQPISLGMTEMPTNFRYNFRKNNRHKFYSILLIQLIDNHATTIKEKVQIMKGRTKLSVPFFKN